MPKVETKTQERPQQQAQDAPQPEQSKGPLAIAGQPRLPYVKGMERLDIDQAMWRVLVEAVFPAAKTVEGVLLAVMYCRKNGYDVMRRMVHVVPIYDKEKRRYVEGVWPGIALLRATAHRSNEYAGCDETVFGDWTEKTFKGEVGREGQKSIKEVTVRFPVWAQITVYRWSRGKRVAYPGPKTFWLETYGSIGASNIPNDMWVKRSAGQLEKCSEAAALRKAFPEELGSEPSAEEIRGGDLTGDIPPRPTLQAVTKQLENDQELVDQVRKVDEQAQPPEKTDAKPPAVSQERQEPQGKDKDPSGIEALGRMAQEVVDGVVEQASNIGHDPETGEVDDGFAVIGFDEAVVWGPRDDSTGFVTALAKLMGEAASRDALTVIYGNNRNDIKKLSPEQKATVSQALSAAMEAKRE